MKRTKAELTDALSLPEYPRSSKYDAEWLIENWMGPNCLWLMEALTDVMELEPGMRVLDMGCGRAATSIFLAREFGVEVWATDLWIDADQNWQRIRAAGVQDKVFPIHAEARALPFARGFFDASVSVDAYHYFGTDDLYIDYYAQRVRAGGKIGIVVPGLTEELSCGVPDHLKPYWEWEFGSFHGPAWWRNHWEKTGKVDVHLADMLPDGWLHWLKWNEIYRRQLEQEEDGEIRMLRADEGRNLGFTRIVAHVPDEKES